MGPKKSEEKKNFVAVRGAIVTCADPCAYELMLRLNMDSNGKVMHTPLQGLKFFVEDSKVESFQQQADALLNPLGRKRARPPRVQDPFEEDVDEV